MAAQNPDHRKLTKSVMYMENLSFDPVYEVLTRIPLTMNTVTGGLERQTSIQGNGSFALSYDGDGNLTTMDKVISGVTYRKTFTWTAGKLTAISTWSIV